MIREIQEILAIVAGYEEKYNEEDPRWCLPEGL